MCKGPEVGVCAEGTCRRSVCLEERGKQERWLGELVVRATQASIKTSNLCFEAGDVIGVRATGSGLDTWGGERESLEGPVGALRSTVHSGKTVPSCSWLWGSLFLSPVSPTPEGRLQALYHEF